MYVGKLITIKIPTKGKLQMTGCIIPEHSELCVKYLWQKMIQFTPTPKIDISDLDNDSIDLINSLNYTPETSYDFKYTLLNSDSLQTSFRTVMTDIVFNLGFNVDRQSLDKYMNINTEFNSLLETSFGYTGVNIKKQFEINYDTLMVKQINCNKYGIWETKFIPFKNYLSLLPSKDREKELNKKRRNTFLIFHSGTAIMSGMIRDYMRPIYNMFIDIIKESKHVIKENIITE